MRSTPFFVWDNVWCIIMLFGEMRKKCKKIQLALLRVKKNRIFIPQT